MFSFPKNLSSDLWRITRGVASNILFPFVGFSLIMNGRAFSQSSVELPVTFDALSAFPIDSFPTNDLTLSTNFLPDRDLLFVSANTAGVEVRNATDYGLLDFFDTDGLARRVAVENNLAYVTDDTAGVSVWDISDSENVLFSGSFTAGISGTSDIEVVNGVAHIAYGNAGYYIVDFNIPSTPIVLNNYTTPDFAKAIQVIEDDTYVSAIFAGLRIFDNRLPQNEQTEVSFNVPGFAEGFQIEGNTGYIAAFEGGVHRFDISGASPVVTDSVALEGQMYDIVIAPDFIIAFNFQPDGSIFFLNKDTLDVMGQYHSMNSIVRPLSGDYDPVTGRLFLATGEAQIIEVLNVNHTPELTQASIEVQAENEASSVNSENLQAVDTDNNPLTFVVESSEGGFFRNRQTGAIVTEFTQANLNDNQIEFFRNSNDTPTVSVSVADGWVRTPPQPVEIRINPQINNDNGSNNSVAIVAGTTAAIGGTALCCCFAASIAGFWVLKRQREMKQGFPDLEMPQVASEEVSINYDEREYHGPKPTEVANRYFVFKDGFLPPNFHYLTEELHKTREQLVKPLGKGQFGEVWLGYDKVTTSPVAIKIVSSQANFSSMRQEAELQRKIYGIQLQWLNQKQLPKELKPNNFYLRYIKDQYQLSYLDKSIQKSLWVKETKGLKNLQQQLEQYKPQDLDYIFSNAEPEIVEKNFEGEPDVFNSFLRILSTRLKPNTYVYVKDLNFTIQTFSADTEFEEIEKDIYLKPNTYIIHKKENPHEMPNIYYFSDSKAFIPVLHEYNMGPRWANDIEVTIRQFHLERVRRVFYRSDSDNLKPVSFIKEELNRPSSFSNFEKTLIGFHNKETHFSRNLLLRLITNHFKKPEEFLNLDQYIMPVLDFFLQGQDLYIVTLIAPRNGEHIKDLLANKNLDAQIHKELMAYIAHALYTAIKYLHNNDFIHHDIKLDNILFDKTGRPLLNDFGESINTKYQTSYYRGFLPYQPPEAIISRNNKEDIQSNQDIVELLKQKDLWALFVTLVAMAIGKNNVFCQNEPFNTQNNGEWGPTTAFFRRLTDYKHFQNRRNEFKNQPWFLLMGLAHISRVDIDTEGKRDLPAAQKELIQEFGEKFFTYKERHQQNYQKLFSLPRQNAQKLIETDSQRCEATYPTREDTQESNDYNNEKNSNDYQPISTNQYH